PIPWAPVSSDSSDLDFQENYFAQPQAIRGVAHKWDSTTNTYSRVTGAQLQSSPLRIGVRNVHIIWNLYDGYDWKMTRDTISQAVHKLQSDATDRARRGDGQSDPLDEDEESVVGDFLFNSIYIDIPPNHDPQTLPDLINQGINDFASETTSQRTSTTMGPTAQPFSRPAAGKPLKLARSKRHKITIELKGVAGDLVIFPPGRDETQSSLDIRVEDLEIFDHITTSTWKKFATYMRDAGERETGASMVHIELLTVKPVPDLAASEIVLKATVLPLRLHVDQDALDFLTRFFAFKDDSQIPDASPAELPFIQRAEVNSVPIKLDFKPKRIDYDGLRSGRTTEFMNFFVLDEANMTLRHCIIYGISGFEKLGQTLNDIWMPDIRTNQLPGVLAGLAPIKPLVGVSNGLRNLVVVPVKEYRRDGRVVRSLQKGATSFAKTTTTELVKMGAKLAIGTQTALQSAESFFTKSQATMSDAQPLPADALWEDISIDHDEKAQVSLYAHQPIGVKQGLRGGYSSLSRDLALARDVIIAVPAEVTDSGSATQAARALLRRAPTIILRPAIGATKAVGQTLLGAGNTLDPAQRRHTATKHEATGPSCKLTGLQFSAKQFETFYTSVKPLIDSKYSTKVQVIFRPQVQPWHPSSTLVHEAALAVLKVSPDAFWSFSHALFKDQKAYFDENVVNETRNQTYSRLAKLAASVGVNEKEVSDLLAISDKPSPDGSLNKGNGVTNDLKKIIKVRLQKVVTNGDCSLLTV
ncbi:autophagy- protein 2, partial [Ascosphaera acerosa]